MPLLRRRAALTPPPPLPQPAPGGYPEPADFRAMVFDTGAVHAALRTRCPDTRLTVTQIGDVLDALYLGALARRARRTRDGEGAVAYPFTPRPEDLL